MAGRPGEAARMRRAKIVVALAVAASGAPRLAAAQHEGHPAAAGTRRITAGGGASAILVATQVDPAVGNRRLREGYVVQPMLHGHLSALGGTLGIEGMLDFEGATLKRASSPPAPRARDTSTGAIRTPGCTSWSRRYRVRNTAASPSRSLAGRASPPSRPMTRWSGRSSAFLSTTISPRPSSGPWS